MKTNKNIYSNRILIRNKKSHHFPRNGTTTTVWTGYWEPAALLHMILKMKNCTNRSKSGNVRSFKRWFFI